MHKHMLSFKQWPVQRWWLWFSSASASRVHEHLLAEAETCCTTGNFWLTGWLQQQIRTLRGGANPPLSFR